MQRCLFGLVLLGISSAVDLAVVPLLDLKDGRGGIPQLGLGTYLAKGDDVYEAVKIALDAGYRHIDTAVAYKNHRDIARAIKDIAIPRDDIFITSKIPRDDLGQQTTEETLAKILEELETDYIDLCLLHHPGYETAEPRIESWGVLENAFDDGRCKHIGVSNYKVKHLEEMKLYSRYRPVINQIECHPYLTLQSLNDYCLENDILIEAYGSIVPKGSKDLLEDATIKSLAEKYGRTPAQILLRWAVDVGMIILPKSVTPSRIVENSNVFDFQLSNEDILSVSDLNQNKVYFVGWTDYETPTPILDSADEGVLKGIRFQEYPPRQKEM